VYWILEQVHGQIFNQNNHLRNRYTKNVSTYQTIFKLLTFYLHIKFI